jgi:hypothetical protein
MVLIQMAYEMRRNHTCRTWPADKYTVLVEVLEQIHRIGVRRRSDRRVLFYNCRDLASIDTKQRVLRRVSAQARLFRARRADSSQSRRVHGFGGD